MIREELKKCVLLFFLDAFRYDYLNSTDTPFIYERFPQGIHGRLKTILGFDGIAATIFTGTYPDVHGVWTQYTFDPQEGEFNWIRPFSSVLSMAEGSFTGSEQMRKLLRFMTLELSLLSRGSTQYPGTNKVPFYILPNFGLSLKRKPYETNAFGPFPSLFDILNSYDVPFEVADHDMVGGDDRVVRKVLKIHGTPKVIYVRFMDLDEVTHAHGIDSQQRLETVRKTDAAVESVVRHVERVGLEPIIFLFADHGMVKVTKTIDVASAVRQAGLREGKDFVVFLDSTMARFWAERPILMKIQVALEELKNIRQLKRQDLLEYHAPLSRKCGDIIYLADPGVIVLPNFYQGTEMALAMHGYTPLIPDQDSLFMLSCKDIERREIDAAYLTDILPTTLDLLGIPKPPRCSGHSLLSEQDLEQRTEVKE